MSVELMYFIRMLLYLPLILGGIVLLIFVGLIIMTFLCSCIIGLIDFILSKIDSKKS